MTLLPQKYAKNHPQEIKAHQRKLRINSAGTVKYDLIQNNMTKSRLSLKFWKVSNHKLSKERLSDKCYLLCVISATKYRHQRIGGDLTSFQNGKLALNYKTSITKRLKCGFTERTFFFFYRILCARNESNFYAFSHQIIALALLASPKILSFILLYCKNI